MRTSSPGSDLTGASISGAPTTSPSLAVADPRPELASRQQHGLATSVFLHLFPGVLLIAFVIGSAPWFAGFGIPAPFVLFIGIPVVIVPVELGVLLWHAKRTTGAFRLGEATVGYRKRLPRRQLVRLTAMLAGWFLMLFLFSSAVIDPFLAERYFAWLPETVLQFSTFEDGGVEPSTLVVVLLLAIAFVCNGVVGPVVEELYFRGYLLPRISRLGRGAPLLNTVLFSLYHLWTPWQNPARILGLLPMTWMVWRKRSLSIGVATHVTVNLTFLLLLLVLILGEVA